ncbi:Tetratricopeptide repeat protein [Leptospira santarosai]|uniref:Tetratricopeptide repeat protein n=1 Tax=Leptospira santarosai TaxID=28183 RepID=A0A2P1QQW9_9LEPT|nr:Tetratricopeptide repeat protein [Leptospira santarosai]
MKKLEIMAFHTIISLIFIYLPLTQIDAESKNELFESTKTTDDIKLKISQYIKDKKYNSAFQFLKAKDPENKNIDLVLLKEDLALNYFVNSLMHQGFAFKDLEKTESIFSVRGSEGNYVMYSFPIDKIIQGLLKIEPNHCLLNRGLGDFYFEVSSKYGENWFLKGDELFKAIESPYLKTVQLGCADAFVFNWLGHQASQREDYNLSIKNFQQALTLKPEYPYANYGIAYSLIKIKKVEEALGFALNAYSQFETQKGKGDASRLLGLIYSELKNDPKAMEYLELSNKITPNHYGTLGGLVDVYARIAQPKLKRSMNEFFNLAPKNPTIYNNLYEICSSNGRLDDLVNFYKEKLLRKENDEIIDGSLNFYIGQIYLARDKALAKKHLIQARNTFSKIYAKSHEVFIAIDQGLASASQ